MYVYVFVSLFVLVKRKRLYESPRAVTRLTVYRPRRVRGQGGASWHFEKDLTFYDIGGRFLRILENP